MRAIALPLVGLLALPLAGCVSLKMGAGPGSSLVRIEGPVNAHVSAEAPQRGDAVVDVGVLGNTRRHGEIVSVDVWPLVGVGVGLAGARASVLGLEVGVGTLLYDPAPEAQEERDGAADPEAEPEPDPEP